MSETSNKILEEVLGIAAHELKTPLSALKTQLELVLFALAQEQEPPRDRILQLVRKSHVQCRRLEEQISRLMDVVRLSDGRLDLQRSPVDLVELATEVIDRLKPELAHRRCRVALEADHPVLGHWDRGRLEQVLTNLISNAARYGAGSAIRVQVESLQQRARIVVRDQGVGIAPEDLEKIFERFERAGGARHDPGGLGLGLYIVRQIVQSHGGRVWAESEPRQGSSFIVELPRIAS